ncbi:MAG: hypothetical protein NC320_07300 [Clostridium sp.]|nr:hypothetical protein [Clostridium sp.]
MNVSKIFLCDMKEGIIKNKRFIIVPLLAILECLYAHMNINSFKEYHDITKRTNIIVLIAEIFHGCDPIAENTNHDVNITIPYLWLAIFVLAVFIGFDYVHNDLTQFGIQILSRIGRRREWWFAKCICNIASSIWFYILFMLTAIIFGIINGYHISFSSDTDILNIIADRSVMYTFIGINEINFIQSMFLALSPLLVICTLNMIQMLLSLFTKPMYSYLIIIGILAMGVLTDFPVSVSRLSMITFSNQFFKNGYNIQAGTIICFSVIAVLILIGSIYFKHYDILPDKE